MYKRRHAVVGQLPLRGDALHEVHVLARDDALVAADVAQAVHPSAVGGQDGLVRLKRRKAPGAGLTLQPGDGRRRDLQQRRVGGGVEAAGREHQVQRQQGRRADLPAARAQVAARPQQDEPRAARHQGESQQVAELITGEHARVGEDLVRLRQAMENSLRQRFQLRVEEPDDEQRGQRRQTSSGQSQTQAAAPGLGCAPRQPVRAEARQHCQAEAHGEDPAEGGMQLVDARQQPQQPVRRQAEHEAQPGQGQQQKEPGQCARLTAARRRRRLPRASRAQARVRIPL